MLENTFNNLKGENNYIFFEGQIYDAYSLLLDILKEINKKILMMY